MAQQPLTPAGVQQKKTDLYALSDSQLITQANLIKSDLRTWLKNNFVLDASQQSYLTGMDEQWIQLAACQTSCAVRNRLPVQFTIPNPPPVPPQPASKIIRHWHTIVTDYSPNGGFVANGTLYFEMIYQ